MVIASLPLTLTNAYGGVERIAFLFPYYPGRQQRSGTVVREGTVLTTAVGYLTDRLIGPDTKPAAAATINDKSKPVRAAKKLVADSRLPPMP
jgi:hypothetical protein